MSILGNINDINNKVNYINKLNSKFNHDNKSLTEILSSFSQLPDDYYKYNDDIEINKYSSYDFSKCSKEEQNDFINEHMQFIETMVAPSITSSTGMIWTWYEIYKLMTDDEYANTPKRKRRAVWPTATTKRPVSNNAFLIWNGLQVLDIDIKNYDLANKFKKILFDELSKYHWFLGISFSASGNSLHVWTKITPIGDTLEHKRVEYYCNFRHKYSYLYITMLKYKNETGITKDDIIKFIDMAMSRPQQGIYIASDKNPYINMNFRDRRLDTNFEQAYSTGISSIDWITYPDLKEIFSKLHWFANDSEESNIDISEVSNIEDRDKSKSRGKRHYVHVQRWQIANTLTALYGAKKALEIFVDITKGTSYNELAGDIKTASIHNKPISQWAISELNRNHGFNIKVNIENRPDLEKLENIIKDKTVSNDIDPIKILNDNTTTINLYIKNTQYLSDIKNDIINSLGKITLLEAGAGYGKTEMIKSLNSKTLLILPFTSTIKAKVEASEVTKDWISFYGKKRPELEDILGDKNMTMTIDKFSRLNIYELNQANFEYIVIDESHLLFTSSYRNVMSPCIQRLANCRSKVIMMSGTPTGEMLFFPGITHIKVYKDDIREKKVMIHLVPRVIEKKYEMCLSMAKDIVEGKKILFPTNRGNLYYEQITGIIQQIITDQLKESKVIKSFYYKKSNYGDTYMDSINVDKSIGDNDIIFCTTYLSVGVDICDKYKFSVYFDELWIPQDIEQFANRLRNNNLYINLFLETEDSQGLPIDYTNTKPLDLSFNEKEVLCIRDITQSCNDMLARNAEESKYNPIISSLLNENPFIKYDENECEYFIDETAYKLRVFEERYSEYSKQLSVLQNMMKYYGYDISIIKHTDKIPDEKTEEIEMFFKDCRNKRFNYCTTQTMMFLDHINDGNIDIYKELMQGSYEIFKDEKFEVDRNENNLYCTDIEILEKNIPIVTGLYKFYNCDTIKDIFKYCIESKQNKINYTKLKRICRFVNIEHNRKRKRLDFPIMNFVKSAHDWAIENHITTAQDILKWQANYAVRYANSIKDVVVDDNLYLEKIFEIIKELWSVVIIQQRPKNNKISITPFELLWTHKTDINDIYGGSEYTKEFFLQELIDNMEDKNSDDSEDINNSETEEDIPELDMTSKLTLSQVLQDLPNIIHSTFDYNIYSVEDKSNDRFMRKQYNNNALRESVFNNLSYEESVEVDNTPKEQNIFTD